jgi:hypothetical protein
MLTWLMLVGWKIAVVSAPVFIGLYRVVRTGTLKLGPTEARWDNNPYGFIIMVAVFAISLLAIGVAILRVATRVFPD